MADCVIISLKHHTDILRKEIEALRDKETEGDVVISCDGKVFRAHSFMLAICSDYLRVLLESAAANCENFVIVLTGVHSDCFESLMSYMYKGFANLDAHQIEDFIHVSSMLKIKGLILKQMPKEEPMDHCEDIAFEQSTKGEHFSSKGLGNFCETVTQTGKEPVEQVNVERDKSIKCEIAFKSDDIFPIESKNVNDFISRKESVNLISKSLENDLESVELNKRGGNEWLRSSSSNVVKDLLEDRIEKCQMEVNVVKSSDAENNPGRVRVEIIEVADFDTTHFEASEEFLDDAEHQNFESCQNESFVKGSCEADKANQNHKKQRYRKGNMKQRRFPDEGRIYNCEMCSFSTQLLSTYINHKNKHTKPFKCVQCFYTASQKNLLEIHVRSRHLGLRPFSCKFCSFSAITKASITVHERKHTGKMPYKCPFCLYSAMQQATLTLHVNARHKYELGLV